MRKHFLTYIFAIIILYPAHYISAQKDTIYYDANNKVISKKKANLLHRYEVIEKISGTGFTRVRKFTPQNKLVSDQNYSLYTKKDKIRQSDSKTFYSSGQIRINFMYNEGKLNGKTVSYFENGNIRGEYWFNNGKVDKEKSRCFNEKGEIIPYINYETFPSYPGGNEALKEYLQTHLKYPEIARKKKIEGRVTVRFKVNKDGSVFDVKVLHSVNPFLDQEAIRVVKKMPKWNPGTQFGLPVSVYFTVPVNFRLN